MNFRGSFLGRRSFWRRISCGSRLYFDLKINWERTKIINRIFAIDMTFRREYLTTISNKLGFSTEVVLLKLKTCSLYYEILFLDSLSKINWLTGCCKRPLPRAEGPLWDKWAGKFKFLGGVCSREEISGGSWSFFAAADSTSTWKIG